MRRLLLYLSLASLLAVMAILTAAAPPPAGMDLPSYTADGKLKRPAGFRNWVFAGASLGLSYAEVSNQAPPGRMHNVYLQPEAYQHYLKTGAFPEKTMFALVLYEPRQKESISKHGYFSGKLSAVEIAVKDSERFEEGWAYFDFGAETKEAAEPFPKDRCFACHHQNGQVDNVFVQFYPTLRDQRK
jgi:hypothetical protein